jgi:histone H3/H4
MPETKTQRRPPAKKKAAAPKTTASTRRASHPQRNSRKAVDRTTELSEEVLGSLDDGAQTAIDAVRKFVDTVDKALPPRGEGPSRREEITDSALEMAQRLVHTQYEFLHKVVDSAGKTLSRSDNAK